MAGTMFMRVEEVAEEMGVSISYAYKLISWDSITEKANLIRSMSRKGCSPDNAACEGFHGRLKNEFFYGRDWRNVSVSSFISLLDEYLHWYCEERIKMSLGGMSPLQFRHVHGLAR